MNSASGFQLPLTLNLQQKPMTAGAAVGGTRARICKRLWSPGIDSKESIPPAYVAWRASTTTLFLLGS
jgi:hypothetical protein